MTANWFEAKVKYVKVGEDGKEKKMSELYLLDAMSYTEAESRITENLREMIQGDFYIVGLKKSNITELVESNDGNDDKWLKSKVYMVCVSEVFIGFMALDFIGICRLVTFFFGNVCKKALRRALFC